MALGRRSKVKRNKLDATRLNEQTPPVERTITTGPWDAADAPAGDGVDRLDLGPLRVPAVEGFDLRVEVTPEGELVSVTLGGPTGEMQLGAFAAPRTDGIWADVRAELLASVSSQGGTTQLAEGEFGPEIRAEVRTADGRQQLRFLGVDGPRWFLRAVIAGPAAADEELFAPLAAALRQVVVDRGSDPMPVREPLPLRLPKDVADQLAEQQAAAEAAETGEPT